MRVDEGEWGQIGAKSRKRVNCLRGRARRGQLVTATGEGDW